MMRGLYAGVQGLRAHQVRMDVIGNNISNVNTTGFKASRVTFADTFSQMVSSGTRASNNSGGVNSKQIGLGVGVGSIDMLTGGSSMQQTGKKSDLAIGGDGFFVVKDGDRFVYSRAGTFDFDGQGYLVNPGTGQRVQGWAPNANGVWPAKVESTLQDITLSVGASSAPKQTSKVIFDQQLNARTPQVTTAAPPSATTAMKVIDSLGTEHSLTVNLWRTAAATNTWTMEVRDSSGAVVTSAPATFSFDATGKMVDPDSNPLTPIMINVTGFTPGNGATPMNFQMDITNVTQPALETDTTPSTFRMYDYDGFTPGVLENYTIDNRGVVTGYYTNGDYRELGQVALASFSNPAGLTKEGGNNWAESVNSGLALIGEAGTSGRGAIASSSLEMSNVDLSSEFTDLIITQRGFQANSRIITSSDEMLQEIVNLKR